MLQLHVFNPTDDFHGDRLPINPSLAQRAGCGADGGSRAPCRRRTGADRSSIESTPMYLAPEPQGDATHLSALAPLPDELQYWPLPAGTHTGRVDHRAELHAFVAAHRG